MRKKWADEDIKQVIWRMYQETGLRPTFDNWERWRKKTDPSFSLVEKRSRSNHEIARMLAELKPEPTAEERIRKDVEAYLKEVLTPESYRSWAELHGRTSNRTIHSVFGSVQRILYNVLLEKIAGLERMEEDAAKQKLREDKDGGFTSPR